MSKTDKTNPPWVKKFDATHEVAVEHDHRFGECREETLEIARLRNGAIRWNNWRHIQDNCPRYGWVTEACTRTPEEVTIFGPCTFHRAPLDPRFDVPPRPKACPGHLRRRLLNPEVPCTACEEAEALRITCEPTFLGGWAWTITHVYGASEGRKSKRLPWKAKRANARQMLHEATRDWNGNGDTDIEPTPGRPYDRLWWW